MELILGASLMLNGILVGMYVMGRRLRQKEQKILQKEMDKAVEGFTQQYISRYKDIYNA
jgi:hypothetical protein